MTVLTSENQLLSTGQATLPRVNLLPPEIAEQRAFRRIQMGLGAALLSAVAVVGCLYWQAGHGVSSARNDLDAATAQQTQLQGEIGKFGGVTALYNAAAAAQQQLTTAMGDEVRYSQLLNDLSLTIPSNVWLKNVNFTSTPPQAPGAAPAAGGTGTQTLASASSTNVVAGPQAIGLVTFTGVAFSHDDVATWLDAIAGLKTYQNPYFTNSTEALIGSRPVVNFVSTATVLSTAESGRYKTQAGG